MLGSGYGAPPPPLGARHCTSVGASGSSIVSALSPHSLLAADGTAKEHSIGTLAVHYLRVCCENVVCCRRLSVCLCVCVCPLKISKTADQKLM